MDQPQKISPESKSQRLYLNDIINSLTVLAAQEADPEVELLELKKGDMLFEQGDEGDHAYLLIAGVLDVRVKQPDGTQAVIDRAAPGAVIGEMALLSGERRTATVYAVNDAALIRLSRTRFEELAAEDDSGLVDDKIETERKHRLQLTQILGNLIGEFDAQILHALQSQLEWKYLLSGEYLFNQGDEADSMYIVLEGTLSATAVIQDNEELDIGIIQAGETIGEYALLTGEVQVANVRAAGQANVVKIPGVVFEGLTKDYPTILVTLTKNILNRDKAASIRARL